MKLWYIHRTHWLSRSSHRRTVSAMAQAMTFPWWRHQMETFSALLALCAGWPVNSPRKGQWRGVLMFSLICAWINDWVNNREAGDVRRHRAHYNVIVMRGMGIAQQELRSCIISTFEHRMLNPAGLVGVFVKWLPCIHQFVPFPIEGCIRSYGSSPRDPGEVVYTTHAKHRQHAAHQWRMRGEEKIKQHALPQISVEWSPRVSSKMIID